MARLTESCNKAAADLLGYTTLKLKVLQVAAQELLDTWKENEDAGEYAPLEQAMDRLEEAMKKTAGGKKKKDIHTSPKK